MAASDLFDAVVDILDDSHPKIGPRAVATAVPCCLRPLGAASSDRLMEPTKGGGPSDLAHMAVVYRVRYAGPIGLDERHILRATLPGRPGVVQLRVCRPSRYYPASGQEVAHALDQVI